MQVHIPGAGHLLPPLHGWLCKCCSTFAAHTLSTLPGWVLKPGAQVCTWKPYSLHCLLRLHVTYPCRRAGLPGVSADCPATVVLQVSHRCLWLLGRVT